MFLDPIRIANLREVRAKKRNHHELPNVQKIITSNIPSGKLPWSGGLSWCDLCQGVKSNWCGKGVGIIGRLQATGLAVYCHATSLRLDSWVEWSRSTNSRATTGLGWNRTEWCRCLTRPKESGQRFWVILGHLSIRGISVGDRVWLWVPWSPLAWCECPMPCMFISFNMFETFRSNMKSEVQTPTFLCFYFWDAHLQLNAHVQGCSLLVYSGYIAI